MTRCFAKSRLPIAVFAVLALIALLTGPRAEKLGDRFQIALPVLALGCSVLNGHGPEYLLRYTVMFTGLHGTKIGLGEQPINMRPSGSTGGMPSGHTATAVFGASTLLHECAAAAPPLRIVVVLAAAFTGASRMDANAHTIWQVLVGAIWGLICDRAFRSHAPSRRRIREGLARIGRATRSTARKISCSVRLPLALRWL